MQASSAGDAMGDQPQLLPPDLERSSSPRVPTSSSHITGNAAHQAGLAPAADQDFRITTAFQNQAADEHAAEAAAGQSGRGPPDVTGPSAAPQNAQGTPVHAFASPSGQQAQQVLGTRHSKPLTGLGLADQAVNTKELKSGLRLTQLHATTTHELHGTSMPVLAPGAPLFHASVNTGSNALRTRFKSVPPVLKEGVVVYAPAEVEDHLLSAVETVARGYIGNKAYGRLYILWPAQMEKVPKFIRQGYTRLDSAAVTVEWHVSFVRRMLLTLSGRYYDFTNQPMAVYESKTILQPGATFSLQGCGAVGEPADQPYILVIKLAGSDKALITDHKSADPYRPPSAHDNARNTMRSEASIAMQAPPSHLLTPTLLANINAAAAAAAAGGGGCAPDGERRSPGFTPSAGAAGVAGAGGADPAAALAQLGRFMSNSDESSYQTGPLLGNDGKLNFADLPRLALAQKNLEYVKLMILFNVLSSSLRNRQMYEKFELLAVRRQDVELLLILQYKTRHELTARGLAFLLSYMWSMAKHLPPCGLFVKADGLPLHARIPMGGTSTSMGAGFSGITLGDEIQAFLVHYTVNHRNPLSVTSAILRGIAKEIEENEECRFFMTTVASRFQTLNLALLKQLSRLIGHVHSVSLLHRVLDPKPRQLDAHLTVPTVNDTSPIQVALDAADLEFLIHPLVIEFTRRTWQGSAFKAQTSCADARSISVLSPLVGWRLLKDAGFAGGAADWFIRSSLRTWHLYVFTSQTFFNSPRGRWAMHAMSELFFLILFQIVLFYPETQFNRKLVLVLIIMVAGNLLEIVQHVQANYGTVFRISRYAKDLWNALNLITNLGLATLILLIALRGWSVGSTFNEGYQQGSSLQLAFCTMAVFVWLRSLSFVVPVFPRLGPLLITVARMLNELVAFLLPLFVVMAGFASVLVGAFHERVTDYGTFIQGLLTMFQSMLGGYSYSDFETDEDGNPFPLSQYLFGSIVLSIYLILTSILLLNLLIAIITNRYRPDDLEAEMQMKITRIVEYYQLQVQRNLVCSPWNIPQLLVSWIPALPRAKNRPSRAHLWGLLPLDGPSTPCDESSSHLRTGWAEVPHLCYLLTLYVALAVYAQVSFYLYTPFAILRFTNKTFTRILRLREAAKVAPDTLDAPKAVAEAITEATDSYTHTTHTNNPTQPRLRPSVVRSSLWQQDSEGVYQDMSDYNNPWTQHPAGQASAARSARPANSAAGAARPVAESFSASDDVERGSAPGQHVGGGVGGGVDVSAEPTPVGLDEGLQHSVSEILQNAAPGFRSDSHIDRLEASLRSVPAKGLSFIHGLLYWVMGWALIVFGILLYVLFAGLLIGTLWTTVYVWLGKIVYSLHNIFLAPWIQLVSSEVGGGSPPGAGGGPQSGPSEMQASDKKKETIRNRWKATAKKATQVLTDVAKDDVMRPKDFATALSNSKFARLLPKWGCQDLLNPTDGEAEAPTDATDPTTASLDPQDAEGAGDDDDESPNQDVIDAISELERTQERLVAEIVNLKKKLSAS